MKNTVNTNLDLHTRVRIYVLYDVIKKLAAAFDFPKYIEETLSKGIKERQILESVYAYYIDEAGKAVGKVSLDIDWETHEMYAKTESGMKITLREDIPLIDQFANWAKDIINYVSEMQHSLGVKKVKVYYRYRKEIRNDPVKDKEADDFLKCSCSTKKYEFDPLKSTDFERKMSYVSDMLPELKINIQSYTTSI